MQNRHGLENVWKSTERRAKIARPLLGKARARFNRQWPYWPHIVAMLGRSEAVVIPHHRYRLCIGWVHCRVYTQECGLRTTRWMKYADSPTNSVFAQGGWAAPRTAGHDSTKQIHKLCLSGALLGTIWELSGAPRGCPNRSVEHRININGSKKLSRRGSQNWIEN